MRACVYVCCYPRNFNAFGGFRSVVIRHKDIEGYLRQKEWNKKDIGMKGDAVQIN